VAPETEYVRMNIGSRQSKRMPGGGIESLRAISWIVAWMQTSTSTTLGCSSSP
jgi:phosphoenolpyruvate carboxylase